MRINVYKNKEPKIQKNRINLSMRQTRLQFGTVGIYTPHNLRITNKLILVIKKLLKFRLKRKKWKKKSWHFLSINYPISKKSTNSRMGKGKGSFIGWLTKVRSGTTIFEFKGISNYRIQKLLIEINKKLTFKLKYFTKKHTNYKYH